MSTTLMNLQNNDGTMSLTRVNKHGTVKYSVAVTNYTHRIEEWETGCRHYSFLVVDAETILNMARHVEASEKEMRKDELDREILTLQTKLAQLKEKRANL